MQAPRLRRISTVLAVAVAALAALWAPNSALAAPPTATTEAATGVKDTLATLNATVNPGGVATGYEFEYGLTASYGSKATLSAVSAGSGASPVAVKQTIDGLEPNTLYHYRVVATNSEGTAKGADTTFTTAFTDVATSMAGMATTEPFDGGAGSVANFGANWFKLGWTANKGEDLASGWKPPSEFSNGAYLNQTIADTGQSVVASATLAAAPTAVNQYFSLWVDMPNPGGLRGGYELRFTLISAGTYKATLSKWVTGTQTVLATLPSTTLAAGNSIALADINSNVIAWVNTGAGYKLLFGAIDSSLTSSGKTALEGVGSAIRLTKFKAGALLTPVADSDHALRALRLRDPLTTVENPLSGGGAWSAFPAAWGTANVGQVYTGGWGPTGAPPSVSGAYWSKAPFADTGAGSAAIVTPTAGPGIGKYYSLWIDMPNPAASRSGYELRMIEIAGGGYEVLVSTWSAGAKGSLLKTFVTAAPGQQLALVDKGGTVSVWLGSGGGAAQFTQIASAADSSYNAGYAGVESSSSSARLREFRAGPMPPT
ncbi:MAG TPA: fibronectin type III domain-containing protein [Solirubrobacterales bacterium]|jgi:hypothetical protein|nr:fibronectin type III domain-containing protein [Solirubrobacterales bacterium]